jgi:MFS family permease
VRWCAAALAPTLPLLAVALAVTGAVSAPAFIVSVMAAADLVPESGRTEVSTWVATSANAGVALGAAGAGVISDSINIDTALLAGAAVLGLTAIFIVATRTRQDPAAAAQPADARTEQGNP